MTPDDLATQIKKLCPRCAQGKPVVPHLGGKEWIHSIYNRTSLEVSLCQANALRIKYQDVLQNG